ncbi:MAG: ABC transporter ATP-binding protein [Kiritimatiellae bacterium]|jgi:ATP-binding cassette subfamily B multidrug efflux pump|nr:ABC transporter ATP-binding protein [Kiritimatiellia bacterium]
METRLYKYLLKYKYKFFLGIIFIFALNFLQIKIPQIQGHVIDLLTDHSIDKKTLFYYILIILALASGTFILTFISRLMILGANSHFDYFMRGKLFEHILALSMNYFTKNGAGEIMALTTNDLSQMRRALSRGFTMITSIIILFILASYQMFNVNHKLMMLVMIPFPLTIFIIIRFGPVLRRKHRIMRESFADLTNTAQENISAIQVVKAFTQEKNEVRRFTEKNKKNFNSHISMAKTSSVFRELIYLTSTLSLFILLLYGGNMVIDGKITIGEFIACNTYVLMLIRPITMLGMVINVFQQSSASWKRIAGLLGIEIEITETVTEEEFRTKHKTGEMLNGNICFNDLSFTYTGEPQPALHNINLKIDNGTSIGIIGHIGSGKTTLVNLIMRLYETPERNNLQINGFDIKDIPLSLLRRSIGYVPQDDFLFSDTISNNIDFNEIPLGIDKIENAAKASEIHESILSFTKGYETKLGERGVNMSGGQKQRISIARAIIRNASIIILDDCLSAVDTHTEEKILKGLKQYTDGKTTIIIGHRISTVQDCDQIVVLDHGTIVEQGAHEQLLKNNGLYKKIFDYQQLEEEIESI